MEPRAAEARISANDEVGTGRLSGARLKTGSELAGRSTHVVMECMTECNLGAITNLQRDLGKAEPPITHQVDRGDHPTLREIAPYRHSGAGLSHAASDDRDRK